MSFEEIVAKEQLGREGRLAYRIIKRRFGLSDDDVEDLKADLIDAKRVAIDEEGKVLVWVGGTAVTSPQVSVASPSQPPAPQPVDSGLRTPDPKPQTLDSSAERRQLTVMFCDLV